jgi:hypothetical protein
MGELSRYFGTVDPAEAPAMVAELLEDPDFHGLHLTRRDGQLYCTVIGDGPQEVTGAAL